MKRMKLLVVVALALVICLPGMAGAVTSVGDPQVTNSWSQRWEETMSGSPTFNALEFFITDSHGITFETPGFRNFRASGWTVGDPNPYYALAPILVKLP